MNKGDPFIPEVWQADRIIRPLFGWVDKDGLRRFTSVTLFIPRKNGKTFLIATLLVIFLTATGEDSPCVYLAAASKDQAKECYQYITGIIEQNPRLRKRLEVQKTQVLFEGNKGILQVLSKAPKTKHGQHAYVVLSDEIHAHQDSELIDVLESGTSARREPVRFKASTAGTDVQHFAHAEFERAKKQQAGNPVYTDDRTLSIVYAAEPDDDWRSPATWEKANPNLDVSVSRDYLTMEARRAELFPAKLNSFRQLHLNVYSQVENVWISQFLWEMNDRQIDVESLKGKACVGGLDLSTRIDMTAFVLTFKLDDGGLVVVPQFFLPKEGMQERIGRDKVRYDLWADQGFITLIPGSTIDDEFVRGAIVQAATDYQLLAVGYDPWKAKDLVKKLADEDGITMVAKRQGFQTLGEACIELESLLTDRLVIHNGNPVLRWNVQCCTLREDANKNVMPKKPDKKTFGKRIDGVMALVDAMATWEDAPEPVEYTPGMVMTF